MFSALAADADIVLIDAPPVLPVTDALVLFRHVDATLMVFSADTTTRKEAAAAMAKVRQVDGPVIGAVLNGVKAESGYGYGYATATSPPTGAPRTAPRRPRSHPPTAARHRSGPRGRHASRFARPPAEG